MLFYEVRLLLVKVNFLRQQAIGFLVQIFYVNPTANGGKRTVDKYTTHFYFIVSYTARTLRR